MTFPAFPWENSTTNNASLPTEAFCYSGVVQSCVPITLIPLIWTSWIVTMAGMSGIQNKVNRRQFMGQCAHTVGSMESMGSDSIDISATPARAGDSCRGRLPGTEFNSVPL